MKVRLKEIGFTFAEGINVQINNEVIPAHKTSNSVFVNNITYSISLEASWEILNKEKMLDNKILNHLIYVEGHLCFDSKKYVLYKNKHYQLTDYARNHIDECCIAFEVDFPTRITHYDFSPFGSLNRKQNCQAVELVKLSEPKKMFLNQQFIEIEKKIYDIDCTLGKINK